MSNYRAYTSTGGIRQQLRDQILAADPTAAQDLDGTSYNSLITLSPDHSCGPRHCSGYAFHFDTRPPFVWAGGHRV